MFVPAKNLEKEKDHVEGFAAEVAWVTKAYVLALVSPENMRHYIYNNLTYDSCFPLASCFWIQW